ncbi:unnamed protein product, partial [Symbiodinium microadriaticum]
MGKHKDSLLNPANRKFLGEMMANIRVACCGGGHTCLTLNPFVKEKISCLELLSEQLGLARDPHQSADEVNPIVEKISKYISDTVGGIASQCEWCKISLIKLIITPCGHLYCPDCMDIMGDFCEKCCVYFDWNILQRLQPGFQSNEYQFDPPLPSVPPADNPLPPGRSVLAISPPTHCAETRNCSSGAPNIWPSTGVAASSSTASSPNQWGCVSTKTAHLLHKIMEMEKEYNTKMAAIEKYKHYRTSEWQMRPPVIPKVIVFSQFFEFLDRVAIDLQAAGVKHTFFFGKQRAHNLTKFRMVSDMRVLLLPRDGSHGLDLSFVTHIFLMDSILDESLLFQVVSRAYRMGAKQSVQVEELIMANTIEEVIYRERENMRVRCSARGDESSRYSGAPSLSAAATVAEKTVSPSPPEPTLASQSSFIIPSDVPLR